MFILTSKEVKGKIEEEEEKLFQRLFGRPEDLKLQGKDHPNKSKMLQTKKRR